MDKIEFEIPGLPKTRNQMGLANRWVQKKENDLWKKKTMWALHLWTIEHQQPLPKWEKIKFIFTRCSSHKSDRDGRSYGYKYVIDTIVKAGKIVKDDCDEYVLDIKYEWEKAPPKQGKIKVVIEKVE